jgi:fluoride exporter
MTRSIGADGRAMSPEQPDASRRVDRAEQRRIDPELPPAASGGTARRNHPGVLLAISTGGVGGTAARYAVGRVVHLAPGSFPWATFAINVTGSFLLGAFLAWLLVRRPADRYLRPFVAIGVLGGYTTFSTAMVETAVLGKDGHVAVAAVYVVASLAGGLAAVAAGFLAARPLSRC